MTLAVKTLPPLMELIIESAPMGIIVVDQAGKVALLNAQAEKLFGYSREELINQSMEILVPVRFRGRHPDQRRQFSQNPGARAMGAGRDLYGLRKDGSEFPVEIGLNSISVPGGVLVISSFIDITVRKRAEEAVRESEGRFRAVTESAKDAIISSNRNGNIVYFNRAAEQIFGYVADEVMGRPLTLIMPERFREAHQKGMEQFLATGEPHAISRTVEFAGRRKDGVEFPLEMSLSTWDTGGEKFFTGILRDISSRRQLEAEAKQKSEALERGNIELSRRQEIMARLLDHLQHSQDKLNAYTQELKRSNEDMEHFAYVTSHDLQEPLRKIISFAEMLEEDLRKVILDETAKQRLRYVVDSARRMRALIQDLLQYSRVGRGGLTKETVDSGKVVAEVISVLDAQIRDTGAEIRFNSLPRVFVHPGQFRQLLQNLLGNAVKYHAARPPVVEIDAAKKDGDHIFSVKDNGIGFEPEFSERIFEIFQRLHTREEYPGTGIGLAICKKIVERHGGRIWAESEPGKGAVFYFTLPSDEVTSGLEV